MKYAIFESGGKQYKAVEGQFVEVDRLAVEPGTNLKLDKVLLLVDGDKINIGTPLLNGSTILATVKEHFKGPKLIVFKYRPKKRIRVKTGHRQTYTRLWIDQVGDTKSPVIVPEEKTAKVEKTPKPVAAKTTRTDKKTTEKKTSSSAKTDSKTTAKKAASSEVKPAAKKTTAKVEKKPATKKTTAKVEKKPATKKSTAKVEKKPAAKKTTAKTEKK